jgi:chitodextrinase
MKQLLRMCVFSILFYCLAVFPGHAAQTTDSRPPSVPAGLCATYRTFTSVSLSWNKSEDDTGVKGYQVFRDGKKLISVTKTSYTNTGLVPGHAYTYSVKAYDAAGNLSEGSIALKVSTVPDLQAPSVPAALSVASAGYTSVSLRWEPSSDNTGVRNYEVYRNGVKAATASKAACTCKGLTPGGKYAFTVKAVDIAGNYSGQSRSLTVETAADRSAPSVPEGLRAEAVTQTEARLCWYASSDNVRVKGYEISCDALKPGKSSKETYTFKNLLPGKSYSFRVAAIDSSGNSSAFGKAVSVKTAEDKKAPSVPGGLKVTSKKSTSVSLAWEASTDDIKVKGYNVYCNGIKIATTTRKTHTAKTSKGFGIYIYTVRAYDQSDNLSDSSKAVTVIQGL